MSVFAATGGESCAKLGRVNAHAHMSTSANSTIPVERDRVAPGFINEPP